MSTYIEVPAPAIRQLMEQCEFTKKISGREEVYQRHHHRDNRYVVRVYSSISDNASVARGCGEDAIRVVALYYRDAEDLKVDRAIPLYKAKRIHRTGSVEKVLTRLHERMQEAYGRCGGVIASGQSPDGPSTKQLNYLRALLKKTGTLMLAGDINKLSKWQVSDMITRQKLLAAGRERQEG